jgi:hypothetical protein
MNEINETFRKDVLSQTDWVMNPHARDLCHVKLLIYAFDYLTMRKANAEAENAKIQQMIDTILKILDKENEEYFK